MVNALSIKAYWQHRMQGRVSTQQAKILDNLNIEGGGSRAELSVSTKLPINVVCGRVKELLDKGFVKVIRHDIDLQTRKEVEIIGLADAYDY